MKDNSAEVSELSLLDLIFIIKQEWRYFFCIVLFVISLSIILIFIWPKTYRAEARLLPPLQSEVEQLNVPGFFVITVDDVYRDV